MSNRTTDIKSRLVGREGFVLPAVLFAMAIMSILAVVALRTASDEQLSSRAVRESAVALYAAEAGVSIVRDAWDKAAVDALASGDSIDTGWNSLSNGAAYRGVIMRGDDTGQRLYTLTVHGRGAGAVGGRRTITVVISENQQMAWAMFGQDGMEINGGVINGDVGTNGSLTFTGAGALVEGNAILGGTVDDPTKVTGNLIEGADPVTMDPVDCPAIPFGPLPTGPGVTFNAATGNINVAGGGLVTFDGGTYFYHDFSKGGGSEMDVPVGAVANIYISGTLSVGGGGFINLNNSSNNLHIWGCGTDATDWSINGNSDVYMTVYAPNHDLTISGSGDRYGSFTAAYLTKTGSGLVEMDFGLSSPTGQFVVVGGSWTQLLN